MNHTVKILKKDISVDKPLFVSLAGEPGLIVFKDKEKFRVLRNFCPHMGGFFTPKNYCSSRKKLICPWHAYEFSTTSLQLEKNPSLDEWISKLVDSDSHYLKLRKMKLVEVLFSEEEEALWVKLGTHEA